MQQSRPDATPEDPPPPSDASNAPGTSAVPDDLQQSEPIPEVPGYDLIEEIGRGGMGVVYDAYQRSTGRRVAVKFMRGVGRSLSLRFEREIDLLARLSHPGVVSVIDSGGQGGRWYYVMEFVDGRPLDEFIAPGKADPRAVLALLASVADIVNEAHQRGVLHRDLKPANILVERDGRVRLLDFGLAKAIDPESGEHAELTISEAGRPMGTLAYMPPEQAAGGSKGISVRSDVYALGVIGFYLLTGEHPIDVDGKLMDVIQRIQTAPVPRTSTLRPGLGADVDAIIGKATAKLPQDRYQTAADLAADIRRWLEGKPITARRLSQSVRVWRWVRRNKAVSAVSVAAALMSTGVVVYSFARVVDERNRAREELAKSEQIITFLDGLLTVVDPRRNPGEKLTVRQAVDMAAERIHDDLTREQPAVAAKLHQTVADTYYTLGEFEASLRHRRAATAILDTLPPRPAQERAENLRWLYHALTGVGELDEAEVVLGRAAEAAAAVPGAARTLERARIVHSFGALRVLQGRFEEAVVDYERALTMFRGLADPPREDIANTLLELGGALILGSRWEDAFAPLEEARKLARSIHGPESPGEQYALTQLAYASRGAGRLEEAGEYAAQAREMAQTIFGPESIDAALALELSGRLLAERGDLAGAVKAYRRTCELLRAHGEDAGKFMPESLTTFGQALLSIGDPGAAESVLREAVTLQRPHENGPDVGLLRSHSEALTAMRRFKEAETVARESIEIAARVMGTTSVMHASCLADLAKILEHTGRVEAAIPVMRESLSIRTGQRVLDHSQLALGRSHLGRMLVKGGRAGEAEAVLHEAVEWFESSAADDQNLPHARLWLGRALHAQGCYAEAEAPLRAAYEQWAAEPSPDSENLARGLQTYAQCVARQGRVEEAERLVLDAVQREDEWNALKAPNAAGSAPVGWSRSLLVEFYKEFVSPPELPTAASD